MRSPRNTYRTATERAQANLNNLLQQNIQSRVAPRAIGQPKNNHAASQNANGKHAKNKTERRLRGSCKNHIGPPSQQADK